MIPTDNLRLHRLRKPCSSLTILAFVAFLSLQAFPSRAEDIGDTIKKGSDKLIKDTGSALEDVGDSMQNVGKPEWQRFVESPAGIVIIAGAVVVGGVGVAMALKKRR